MTLGVECSWGTAWSVSYWVFCLVRSWSWWQSLDSREFPNDSRKQMCGGLRYLYLGFAGEIECTLWKPWWRRGSGKGGSKNLECLLIRKALVDRVSSRVDSRTMMLYWSIVPASLWHGVADLSSGFRNIFAVSSLPHSSWSSRFESANVTGWEVSMYLLRGISCATI